DRKPLYMKTASRTAVLFVLARLSAHAQATLPERVKRSHESSGLIITRQISPADLSSLAAAAEMIVRVVVNSESPRLSENQLQVDTDYGVSVVAVYRGSPATVGQSLVVTKPG